MIYFLALGALLNSHLIISVFVWGENNMNLHIQKLEEAKLVTNKIEILGSVIVSKF